MSALLELADDLERRALSCKLMKRKSTATRDQERLGGKAFAYDHAARLLRAMASAETGEG